MIIIEKEKPDLNLKKMCIYNIYTLKMENLKKDIIDLIEKVKKLEEIKEKNRIQHNERCNKYIKKRYHTDEEFKKKLCEKSRIQYLKKKNKSTINP